jgi:hypothetical protein
MLRTHLRCVFASEILHDDAAVPGRPVCRRLNTPHVNLLLHLQAKVFPHPLDRVHGHLAGRVHPYNPKDIIGK